MSSSGEGACDRCGCAAEGTTRLVRLHDGERHLVLCYWCYQEWKRVHVMQGVRVDPSGGEGGGE